MNRSLADYILVIGSFQAFFLTALVFRKKEKASHDLIIGAWLIFLGLYISAFALSPAGFFTRHPWLIGFYISLLLLVGPFLFWYVKSLTIHGFEPYRDILWHLLPFLLFTLYLNIFFAPGEYFGNIHGPGEVNKLEFPPAFMLFLFITAISVPFYIAWSVRLLRNHRETIADNFSSTEKKNLIWLRNLIVLLGITWIVLAAIIFVHHVLLLFSDDFCIYGLFVILAVFVIIAGYFGLYQDAIFTSGEDLSSAPDAEETIKYSGSSLKEEDIRKYLELLNEYMKMGKPYLNNQLTLHQLAEEVSILPHYLSRIINECYHQNFFDFINMYRIDEFKSRIADHQYKKFTLLAIAFDCGFNSKSSFNRLFKKATGSTPSGYKNTVSGNHSPE